MLAFLLDVKEVPEVCSIVFIHLSILICFFQSHTGATMANAFQEMLEEHGLTEKVNTLLCYKSLSHLY